MSTEQNSTENMSGSFTPSDLEEALKTAAPEAELEETFTGIGNNPEPVNTPAPDIFDLKALGLSRIEDLRKFKTIRTDLLKQKAMIERSVAILDKRITMLLDDIRVIQTPV